MALSLFAPNRTVLLVADEALYIYASRSRGPSLIETVPWDSENFEQNVAGIIARDCGGKPVLILNDMVEQHYRKERVTRGGVGIMDKGNMLRHKLLVAFNNYPVRAAYLLKEKAPKVGQKAAADIYIFAAIPESKQLSQSIASVKLSLASIAGFCLLPVEASDMVKKLSAKLVKKAQAKTQWVIFMGQHVHGGLRQIVIKNGELALTRMTPVMDSDQDAEGWAGEVFQEFNATMSYLARFGFQAEDGLHIIAIANSAPGEALQNMIGETHGFSHLTTAEAARLLGLPLGTQEDYRHADPLHVAWSGRKTKFTLPMSSALIDKVSKPRRIAMAASVILFMGIMFLGYQLVTQVAGISSVGSELAENNDKMTQLNVQYQKEVKRSADLGFDVRLVQSSITVYDGLEKNNIKLLPLYKSIGAALGKNLRLDKIIVEKPQDTIGAVLAPGMAVAKTPSFQAKLQMTFPSTTDIEKGNKEIEDLKIRLQALLTEDTVEVTKRLKDYEYVEEVVVETGDLQKQNVAQDFVAEITIKGPAIE